MGRNGKKQEETRQNKIKQEKKNWTKQEVTEETGRNGQKMLEI